MAECSFSIFSTRYKHPGGKVSDMESCISFQTVNGSQSWFKETEQNFNKLFELKVWIPLFLSLLH